MSYPSVLWAVTARSTWVSFSSACCFLPVIKVLKSKRKGRQEQPRKQEMKAGSHRLQTPNSELFNTRVPVNHGLRLQADTLSTWGLVCNLFLLVRHLMATTHFSMVESVSKDRFWLSSTPGQNPAENNWKPNRRLITHRKLLKERPQSGSALKAPKNDNITCKIVYYARFWGGACRSSREGLITSVPISTKWKALLGNLAVNSESQRLRGKVTSVRKLSRPWSSTLLQKLNSGQKMLISLILMRQKNLKNISFVLVRLKRQDGGVSRMLATWESALPGKGSAWIPFCRLWLTMNWLDFYFAGWQLATLYKQNAPWPKNKPGLHVLPFENNASWGLTQRTPYC